MYLPGNVHYIGQGFVVVLSRLLRTLSAAAKSVSVMLSRCSTDA